MIYCRECTKRHLCKEVNKSQDIECVKFREDLDFLKDSKEEFLKTAKQYQKIPKDKKKKRRLISIKSIIQQEG